MAALRIVCFLFLISLTPLLAQRRWRTGGASGNYGSRRVCSYKSERRCAYSTWQACCSYITVRVPYYYTEYYCLPGWTESSYGSRNCNNPICRPACENGGNCVSPNNCSCTNDFTGPTCQGQLCSHLKPCYPGICSKSSSGGDSTCTCSTGFRHSNTSSGCIHLVQSQQRPEIFQCRIRLSNYNQTKRMEMYGLMLDSSDNTTNSVEVWTNRNDFTHINYTGIAFYGPVDLPPVPSDYISDVKLGIVGGSFTVNHTKLDGERVYDSGSSIRCPSSLASKFNPRSGMYNCTVVNHRYNYRFDDGDRFAVTFVAKAGGYRQLVDINTKANYRKQYYTETTMSKTLTYRFDFKKPKHCFPNCPILPFDFGEDNRKDPVLKIRWSNWTDELSGVFRYAWEIFRLVPDLVGNLREPDPLGPIEIGEVLHSDNINYPNYTLPEPGLYSIILQVADAANNSVYVRRFCLYDPNSNIQISTNPDERLRAISASSESNYTWQSYNNGSINLNWTNLFFNEFLEKNKVLNEILNYPVQFLEEGEREKKAVDMTYQNPKGRTQAAIPNARGITKFQIAQRVIDDPNKLIIPNYWNNVSDPSITTERLPLQAKDGDTIGVWVRAVDALGNERVDSTKVSIDSSPPEVSELTFELSEDSNTSRFRATAHDPHSGIMQVYWRAVRNDTQVEYASGSVHWPQTQRQQCTDDTVCRCLSVANRDKCFYLKAVLPINHCEFGLDDGDPVSINLYYRVDNQAMVSSKERLTTIPDVTDLADCSVDVLGNERFDLTKVSIDSSPPEVSELTFELNEDSTTSRFRAIAHDPQSGIMRVHWRAVRHDTQVEYASGSVYWPQTQRQQCTDDTVCKCLSIANSDKCFYLKADLPINHCEFWLDDGDPVSINLYYRVDNQALMSSQERLTTIPDVTDLADCSGLSGGQIAGIVIGVLILLALIAVLGFVLFLFLTKKRPFNRENTQSVNSRPTATAPSTSYLNNAYRVEDDDLYLYGGMDFGKSQSWQIPHEHLALLGTITVGKFAKIYQAKIKSHPDMVVAKMLKDNYTTDDETLMRAKVNYMATVVGKDPNVLAFIGAVVDNPSLGPVLISEYCEVGQLDKWLIQQRGNVTDDTNEILQHLAFGISKGMTYLASKKIVHKKLAARNVLLTFTREAKITGFGPSKIELEDEDSSAKERIPIKWTAPECLVSLKHANEKSDVWSYGIVLWEIFSLGETPYSNMKSRDVETRVKSGYRMSKPEICEEFHYDLMRNCWEENPKKRNNFKKITKKISDTFSEGQTDSYYYYR